ncbi:ABC transporter permease [Gracilibacillus timonensis]|uniref:ABC transporter permease n=1 Tax=Gracilibacillus timonensis TaxID=1816696 RepID=UPI0008249097|nr:ABC transporter permease [Gracilibacillus timonensis]
MRQLLWADKIKLKRSSILIIVLLVPLLILGYELVNLTYRGEFVEEQAELFQARSMWIYLLYDNSLLLGLGFPLATTLTASVIANIEHQANGWKQTLSLPLSRVRVYLSKFIWLFISLFFSITIFMLGMLLLGKVLGFEGTTPWGLLLGDSYSMLIVVLPMMSVQLWLSMTFKNQAFSILVGAIFSMMGLFLAAAQTTRWFPLAYPSQASTIILQYEGLGYNTDLSAYLVISFCLGMILLVFGAVQFARKEVK